MCVLSSHYLLVLTKIDLGYLYWLVLPFYHFDGFAFNFRLNKPLYSFIQRMISKSCLFIQRIFMFMVWNIFKFLFKVMTFSTRVSIIPNLGFTWSFREISFRRQVPPWRNPLQALALIFSKLLDHKISISMQHYSRFALAPELPSSLPFLRLPRRLM